MQLRIVWRERGSQVGMNERVAQHSKRGRSGMRDLVVGVSLRGKNKETHCNWGACKSKPIAGNSLQRCS